MRWYVLWVLFFVSIVAVRARNRRAINEVMIDLADSTNETNHEKAIAKRETNIKGLLNSLSTLINSIISFAFSIPENIFTMLRCIFTEISDIIGKILNVQSLRGSLSGSLTDGIKRMYTCVPNSIRFS